MRGCPDNGLLPVLDVLWRTVPCVVWRTGVRRYTGFPHPPSPDGWCLVPELEESRSMPGASPRNRNRPPVLGSPSRCCAAEQRTQNKGISNIYGYLIPPNGNLLFYCSIFQKT